MAERAVEEVGRKLLSQSRLNKETTVKLLKQAESSLRELKQSPSLHTALNPLCTALVKNACLQHKDKDVKLLTAACFSEIMRILAPDPPFSDDVLKEIFKLFIGIFMDLGDKESPFLARRLRILEIVAAIRCSVIMLDINCEDLVLEMFKIFFSATKQGSTESSVFQAMLSIITQILEEKVSQPLFDMIIRNLVRDEKDGPYKLAFSIIKNCGEKLEPLIRNYLTSCIPDGDTSAKSSYKLHHRIILEVFQSSPNSLSLVLPRLTSELLAENVDIRLEAVRLIGKLLSLSNLQFGQDYSSVFMEFLRRFSDKCIEIRIAALESIKSCPIEKPLSNEASLIIDAIVGRLLDYEDKARIQAVSVICELAKSKLKSHIHAFPSEIVLQAIERLRDKKVSVRKNVLQKLLELYRVYCDEGSNIIDQNYEQIPCKILLLCFDKDTEAFRPKNMELVLAEDLFPLSLSAKDRAIHWIAFFSLFSPAHIKALTTILSQKKRLQSEMQLYLAQRQKAKEGSDEETQNRILSCFNKMACYFHDASKANEFFNTLHQMKDNNIFKDLSELCNEETTFARTKSLRESFLKRIGSKNQIYNFCKALLWKCSYSLINSELIRSIFAEILSSKIHLESTLDLLLVISNISPSLLKGSEKYLIELFSDESDLANEKSLKILAQSSQYLSINLSEIYPLLEKKCLEGTRVESKYAISTIFSLVQSSDSTIFSNLFKKVNLTLGKGRNGNIATLLQSLGQIAHFCPSIFDGYEKIIINSIIKKIICSDELVPACGVTSSNNSESCSISCKTKIYGLKTLVKCYVPFKVTNTRHELKYFLEILSDLINEEGIFNSISISEYDKPHLRSAASKSILKLARIWDSYISPKLFSSTVLTTKDSSSMVRGSFINKLYKLLKENKIPNRYICAFSFSSIDSNSEIRNNSQKFLTEMLKEMGKKYIANQYNSRGEKEKVTNHPAYIVVYLIPILAHYEDFSFDDYHDEDSYAEFCSPLIVMLKALLGSDILNENGTANISLILLGIFRAIQRAEDSIDPHKTHKLLKLSKIGLIATKLLSKGCKVSSDSPSTILLPSSYYRVCTSNEEHQDSSGDLINETFVKKILKAHDDTLTQVSNELIVKPEKCTNRDAPKTRSKKKAEIDERSIKTNKSDKTDNNSSKSNNNNSQKDKVSSSCGSAGTKPESRSVAGTQEDSRDCASLVENHNENPNSIENCREKLSSGQALVGSHIKLWCHHDSCYRNGLVASFNSRNNCHKIVYDDNGESDLVKNLEGEKWEIITDTASHKDKEIPKFQPKDCFKKGKTKVIPNRPESSRRKRNEEIENNNENVEEKEYSSDDSLSFLKKRKLPPSRSRSKGEESSMTVQNNSILTGAEQRDKRVRRRRN